MQKSVVILFLLFIALSSCQSGQKQKLTEQQKKEYVAKGDSISDFMQGVLLKNVATAAPNNTGPTIPFITRKY